MFCNLPDVQELLQRWAKSICVVSKVEIFGRSNPRCRPRLPFELVRGSQKSFAHHVRITEAKKFLCQLVCRGIPPEFSNPKRQGLFALVLHHGVSEPDDLGPVVPHPRKVTLRVRLLINGV